MVMPGARSTSGRWRPCEKLPGPQYPCTIHLSKPALEGRALTTPPFPSRYEEGIGPNSDLQLALDEALSNGPGIGWRVPVAVVSLTKRNADGTRPFAHHRADEVHYTASLVKVAAMYAAFELLGVLQKIARELSADGESATFFKIAAEHLNPKILAKTKTIAALRGISSSLALPQYKSTFKVVASTSWTGVEVRFTAPFKDALLRMIRDSNNSCAGRVVHGVGYGYLTGALAAGGFFEPDRNVGLFLGGDYSGGKTRNFQVPATNKPRTAQAATAKQLVRLFTLLFEHKLADERPPVGPSLGESSREMLSLLASTVTRVNGAEVFIGRDTSGYNFTVTHNKLGLQGGLCSEASLLTHNRSGAKFAIAWQNLKADVEGFFPITRVVHETLTRYLSRVGP